MARYMLGEGTLIQSGLPLILETEPLSFSSTDPTLVRASSALTVWIPFSTRSGMGATSMGLQDGDVAAGHR